MDWFGYFMIMISKFGYLCICVNSYGCFSGIVELLESDRIYILYLSLNELFIVITALYFLSSLVFFFFLVRGKRGH
jgi:hypothetical protein